MKKILFMLALSMLFAPKAHAACLDLSSDLESGKSGADVLALQGLLRDGGFLTAVPNGNFGPATLSAVKKFQSSNGINATGYVGPSTRAKMKALTCLGSQSSQATPPAQKSYGVVSPRSGEALSIGKSFKISWSTEIKTDYSLILEDEKGIAQGFIASNQAGGKSYVWKVGKLTTSSGDKNAAPGAYRIRVQKTATGPTESDETSAYFTLSAQSLSVSSILPASVVADGSSVVVLYGSGFTASTFVYLDGVRNIQTSRLFVSPDGKAIVFSVPEGVPAGAHYISLKNGYESVENAGHIRVEDRE